MLSPAQNTSIALPYLPYFLFPAVRKSCLLFSEIESFLKFMFLVCSSRSRAKANKDRVDAIGLEHLSVLPHIQYNGTDEPITFFDLIIDVQS